MLFVGIVEMAAAVLVAVRPRIGAYIVVAWLLGIIVNLLLIPGVLRRGAARFRPLHSVRLLSPDSVRNSRAARSEA